MFVTCLVDLMRPAVGFATVKLLEDAGCEVVVPAEQTCCGQPAFNSGDSRDARVLARGVIRAFERVDYLVAPSGSCIGTIRVHYPEMFADDPEWAERARKLAERSFEITTFLHDVLQVGPITGHESGVVTYHDSCSGLRELGVKAQPRGLLAGIEGLELREMANAETCCGFGGLFCVKYPDISEKMVDAKVEAILATGAEMVLGGDMGCLMNIAGRLQRRGAPVGVRHVTEILAGATETTPPIGEPASASVGKGEPADEQLTGSIEESRI